MANLQIKHVPPDLHEALRRRAAEEGLTLSQYLLGVLEQEVSVPSQREWLDRLRREPVVPGVDGVGAIRDARREREAEVGQRFDRH